MYGEIPNLVIYLTQGKIPHLTTDQMYGEIPNLAVDLTQGKISHLTFD
jgi:hypothetical protein